MLRRLLLSTAACGLLLPAAFSFAAEPAPDGATMTMKFKVTVKTSSKADYNSTAIHHVLTAQCTMEAQRAIPYSWDGPTAEQQAAADAKAAEGQALANSALADGNQDAMMALQAEVEKCGNDEACITALTMQMANDPNFLARQQGMQSQVEQAAALQPDQTPRYQAWHPKSCTGEIKADDTYVTSDPGGEGGDGAYTDTVTVAATGPIEHEWPGLFLEVDLQAGTTRYKMSNASVTLASTSSISGAGTRTLSLVEGELPIFGPYPGGPGGHKGKTKSVSAEWSKAQ